MRWNLIGAFRRNFPFGTEIAFQKGLEKIGESVTTIDPSYPDQKFDESADVTVVFKWLDPGPYRDALSRIGGKKIVYQPDDLRFPHIKQMMIDMRQVCDHTFTFDEDGSMLARKYGYGFSRRLLLTADNTLYRHRHGMQKDIDVCFVGSLSNGPSHASRMRMIEVVRKMSGVKLVVANELFDIGKICELYNRSKIVLNHATDVGQPFGHGYGYQCRHFEAGFTKACVLSNSIDNEKELNSVCVFDDEESLKESVDNLIRVDITREIFAEGLYRELYDSHLPEHRAAEMLEFVRDIP